MNKIITGVVFLLLIPFLSKTQSNVSKLELRLTPSPTTGNLGTYGGAEVKRSTGGITKNINLFGLKSGDLSYNPEIQYFSNGFVLDEWGGRFGMGWTDNFTCTIQRTVRSVPDEYATTYPLSLVNSEVIKNKSASMFETLKTLEISSRNRRGTDAEYDLFSFNLFGLSGSFIIKDGKGILLNHTEKVRINVLTTQPYTFSIVKNDGTEYFFGINNDVELTGYSSDNNCDQGGEPLYNIPTGWFLSKVQSVNNNTILFDYTTSEYEYMYDFSHSFSYRDRTASEDVITYVPKDVGSSTGLAAPYLPVFLDQSSCYREKRTSTRYLKSVKGNGWSLSFSYMPRNDLQGDILYKEITLKDNLSRVINRVTMDYLSYVSNKPIEELLSRTLSTSFNLAGIKTRYFLKSVAVNNDSEKYTFDYLSPQELPHRFSFAQDLAGYYNGIDGNGQIPYSGIEDYIAPKGTALEGGKNTFLMNLSARTPHSNAQKGLLKKITYPTGGQDSVIYESNVRTVKKPVSADVVIEETYHSANQETIGKSQPFNIPMGQNVSINVYAGYDDPVYPYDNDGSMHWVNFELWNLTTNSKVALDNVNIPFRRTDITMKLYETHQASIPLIADCNYEFRYTLNGEKTNLDFRLVYKGTQGEITADEAYYGVRVKSITAKSGFSIPTTRLFNYNEFSVVNNKMILGNLSSGKVTENRNVFVHKSHFEFDGIASYGTGYYMFYSISSKNLTDINVFQGQPITYSCVTEFLDSDLSSFIGYNYIVSPNLLALPLLGDEVGSVQLNNGYLNGFESSQLLGKKVAGAYVVLKEKRTGYTTVSNSSYANNYRVAYTFMPLPTSATDPDVETRYRPLSVLYEPLYADWYQLSSVSEREYPENGEPALINDINYSYYPHNGGLKESIKTNSKGVSEKSLFKYAADMPVTPVYQKMLSKNMLNNVIEQENWVNNIKQSTVISDFSEGLSSNTSLILLSTTRTKFKDDQPEVRMRYYFYDDRGNPLSVSQESGMKINYIWSYNGQYPIAEIKGLDYDAVRTVLGGTNITNFNNQINPDKSAIDLFIAPLKLAYPGAEVSSYSYTPLIGMSSQTDIKGQTTYYEYDAFKRLKNIKDQDGNIIKSYEYHFKP